MSNNLHSSFDNGIGFDITDDDDPGLLDMPTVKEQDFEIPTLGTDEELDLDFDDESGLDFDVEEPKKSYVSLDDYTKGLREGYERAIKVMVECLTNITPKSNMLDDLEDGLDMGDFDDIT